MWHPRSCPHGYTCLHSIGENPNYGFTSFDNLLWSMLTTFQAYKTIVIIMITIKLITTPVLIIPNIMLLILQLITLDY